MNDYQSPPQIPQHRYSLVAWLLVPLLLAWIAVNYLIGAIKQPNWGQKVVPANQIVYQPQTNKPTPTPLPPYQWDGKGLVTLWFDDAWLSQYTAALPMVKAHNMVAALAVPTTFMNYDDYMSWFQISKMQSEGWEITSHTRTHTCDPKKLTQKFVDSELIGAKEDLKANGFNAEQFVDPCGVETPYMRFLAKKYYSSFRTSEPGYNPLPVNDPYKLLVQTMRNNVTLPTVKSWVKEAETNKQWLIIMFHQVDDKKTEYSITPKILSSILDMLESSDVHVVLPSQALQLTKKL